MKQRFGVMRAAALTAVLAATQYPANAGFIDDAAPVAKPAPVAEKSPVVPVVVQVPVTPTSEVASVVVPPLKPEVPPPPPEIVWSVVPGSYLRDTLQEWATKAGWSLVWGLSEKEDFRLETGSSYAGDFKNGVRDLINALPARVRIHAELRPDNTPPLLHVTRNDEGSR